MQNRAVSGLPTCSWPDRRHSRCDQPAATGAVPTTGGWVANGRRTAKKPCPTSRRKVSVFQIWREAIFYPGCAYPWEMGSRGTTRLCAGGKREVAETAPGSLVGGSAGHCQPAPTSSRYSRSTKVAVKPPSTSTPSTARPGRCS